MNLLSDFDKIQKLSSDSDQTQRLRAAGKDQFIHLGIPTRRNEDWKYLNLQALGERKPIATALQKLAISQEERAKLAGQLNSDFFNIVFVNGVLVSELSDLAIKGLGIIDFVNQPSDMLKLMKQVSNSVVDEAPDAFLALNQAYLGQGLGIKVEDEAVIKKPIMLTFASQDDEGINQDFACYPRIAVSIGKRAKVQMIERFISLSNGPQFVNEVTEVVVGDSANLDFVRVQDENKQAINIGRTRISALANAQVTALNISLGALIGRHNFDLIHSQARGSSRVDGIYLATGKQQIDNHTTIDHLVGYCQSTQHYKGILDDEAKAIFNGRVVIRKGADKANSEQLNNNLILSRTAEVDSKPQLEIYADDVKATHGSTVGQLNAEEVFYLQSRAIDKETAVKMLSYGFVRELIEKNENESVRNWAEKIVLEKYRQMGDQ